MPKFVKGQVTNPKGRPKLAPELHLIKIISRHDVKAIFSKFLEMGPDVLMTLDVGKLRAIDAIVVNIILKAIEDGDFVRLNFLLDRMHGKVKDEVVVTKNYKDMSDEELLLEAKKEVNEFEAKYKEIKDVN